MEREFELGSLLVECIVKNHEGEEEIGIPSGLHIEITKVTGFVESEFLITENIAFEITEYNEDKIKEQIKQML